MACALTNRASAVVLKLLIFFEVSSSNLLTASGAMSECLSWICFSRLNVQTSFEQFLTTQCHVITSLSSFFANGNLVFFVLGPHVYPEKVAHSRT